LLVESSLLLVESGVRSVFCRPADADL